MCPSLVCTQYGSDGVVPQDRNSSLHQQFLQLTEVANDPMELAAKEKYRCLYSRLAANLILLLNRSWSTEMSKFHKYNVMELVNEKY